MDPPTKINTHRQMPLLRRLLQFHFCSLVVIVALLPHTTNSIDQHRFSLRRLDDCAELTQKSNCQCESDFSRSGFEIMCPKDLSKMGTHKITISLPSREDQPLTILCHQMTAEDYKLLPEMSLGNMSSVRMRYCPLPGFAPISGIFERLGLTGVHTLQFETNNLGVNLTRHHLSGLQNLKNLRLRLQQQTFIPEDLFNDMGNLTWLDFFSHSLQLPPNLFEPLQNLKFLELTGSEKTSLPDGIFRNYDKLTTLHLWGNQLRNFSKYTFEGLSRVDDLDLSANGLETLPSGVFDFLTNLSNINLGSNSFRELPHGLFDNNKNLTKFRLSNNRNYTSLQLPSGLFSNLPILKFVYLNCYMKSIPEDTFAGSPEIIEIQLQDNQLEKLPKMLFNDQRNLRELDLSHNYLTVLPEDLFQHTSKLAVLKLNNNRLQQITSENFRPLRFLVTLYMNNNYLTSIPKDAFVGTPSLQRIELQNNRIKLNTYTNLVGTSPFNILSNLTTLNLRNNSIMDIFDDWKYVLLKLEELDLSFNNISIVEPSDFQYLSESLVKVNMSHNHISRIDFTRIVPGELNSVSKAIFDLNHNPINCDCILPKFLQYIRGKLESDNVPKRSFLIDNLKCQEPENLRDKPLRNLELEELLCPLDIDDSKPKLCPINCKCWVRLFDSNLIIDCSEGNRTTIPRLPSSRNFKLNGTQLNMRNNNLLYLPTTSKTGYPDITRLLLSGNNLKEVNIENLPPRLIELDLRNNQIEQFNESVLTFFNKSRTLKSLKLSHNPWNCDCQAKSLLQYAQTNYKTLKDLNQMQCSFPSNGTFLNDLTLTDLCPEDQTMLLVSIILAVVFFVTCVLAILYVKYQLEIKVWLYNNNMCLWIVTEEELDKDKPFDAFISYSSKDEEFVAKHLVPNLEKGDPSYKICVHYRDFLVGASIAENINDAVTNSRRTIVLLSNNFIESTWGRQEFRTAHLAALEERKPKVIIIIYGEIGNIESLDSELQAYLKTNTYLRWDDSYFWNRLRYAMPHKRYPHKNGLIKHDPIKSSVDDKLELINPSPVTPPLTTPPAEATKNPLIAHLNGGTPQTAIMIANGKTGHGNGHLPSYYTNGKLQNGHINGAFIINTNAKQSDV